MPLEELKQKKIPFNIKRTINNRDEYFKLEDVNLQLIDTPGFELIQNKHNINSCMMKIVGIINLKNSKNMVQLQLETKLMNK